MCSHSLNCNLKFWGCQRLCGLFLLRGPLNRHNAILSLLHPVDRYRTRSGIGVRLGGPISPYLDPRTGRSSQPPRSKSRKGLQPRDSGALLSQTLKSSAKQKVTAIEAVSFRPTQTGLCKFRCVWSMLIVGAESWEGDEHRKRNFNSQSLAILAERTKKKP